MGECVRAVYACARAHTKYTLHSRIGRNEAAEGPDVLGPHV